MKEYIEKARHIMEALPYIKKFNGCTIVIKYGGSAMDDPVLKEKAIEDFILLKLVGMNVIVVHGGGKHITSMMRKLGKEAIFIEGHRVTDDETMDITEMVLSGSINKEIVALINYHGGRAVGLSGKDSMLIIAAKKTDTSGKGLDFGKVGAIEEINPGILQTLSKDGYIPVISPVAMGNDGSTYNVNADAAAAHIAKELKATKLIYITDVKGLYGDINDETTFIQKITVNELAELKKSGAIAEGMLPKTDSAGLALLSGVDSVHIIDGRLEHSILLEVLTDAGIGTLIRKG